MVCLNHRLKLEECSVGSFSFELRAVTVVVVVPQMEKNMDHDMKTGILVRFTGLGATLNPKGSYLSIVGLSRDPEQWTQGSLL